MARVSVIGNVNSDVIVQPAFELPPPGAEWVVESVELRTGGAAGIAASTLASLGVPTRVAGAVGNDDFGDILRRELDARGVEGLRTLPGPTGVSLAFESSGQDRSFLISLGCLEAFDVWMIDEETLAAEYVLFCGYFLLGRLRGAATAALMENVRARGGTTLLDTGWDTDGWSEATRDEVLGLLPLVDVFLPNEMEAAALTAGESPAEAGRALQRRSGGLVVVTLGPGGCVAVTQEGQEIRTPAPPPPGGVSDTTGAGDAFNAGLIAALRDGSNVDDALVFATRVASTLVGRPSTDRYPSRKDLLVGPI